MALSQENGGGTCCRITKRNLVLVVLLRQRVVWFTNVRASMDVPKFTEMLGPYSRHMPEARPVGRTVANRSSRCSMEFSAAASPSGRSITESAGTATTDVAFMMKAARLVSELKDELASERAARCEAEELLEAATARCVASASANAQRSCD